MQETQLIIFEGMDNTGKSTIINRLCNILEQQDYRVTVIHMNKPPENIKTNEDRNTFQHEEYLRLLDKLLSIKTNYDYIILDRSWISEYVYAPIYRYRNVDEIVKDNIYIESKLITAYKFDNINIVYLYANSLKFLMNNEDNKSLAYIMSDGSNYKINSYMKQEQDRFDDAIQNITLLNYLPVVIDNNNDNFRTGILTDIVKNIILK